MASFAILNKCAKHNAQRRAIMYDLELHAYLHREDMLDEACKARLVKLARSPLQRSRALTAWRPMAWASLIVLLIGVGR
jgi:hypothetical protein